MRFDEIDPSEVKVTSLLPVTPGMVLAAALDRVQLIERDYLQHERAGDPEELLHRLDDQHDDAVALLTLLRNSISPKEGVQDMAEPAITKQAYHVSDGDNLPIDRVVIHDEEYPVSNHSAEDIANYFAQSSSGGSAHYVEDGDSEQHCVADNAIAWHAPPNQHSLGIEIDGYARFTSADWNTPGSQASLARAATRAADLCQRYDVPAVWLSVDDLLAGKRGITTHANVSAAWHQSDHTDPGTQFPFAQFLSLVSQAMNQPAPQEVRVTNGRGYAANPVGSGGWGFGDDGGVFCIGPTQFFGSMGGKTMNAKVCALVPTPTGQGYCLVGEDGGLFNFGDAHWNAYGPFETEYLAGDHHVIGAALAFGSKADDPSTWHLEYLSDKLESYVL